MPRIRTALSMIGVTALVAAAPALASMSPVGASSSRTLSLDGFHCSVVSKKSGAVLHGTPNAVVCALGANSKLYAGAGYEVLIAAGGGRNTLVASSSPTSTDVLIGGKGNDTLIGGKGNDTLIGGSGTNVLKGGSGIQTLFAGSKSNSLLGGAGATTLVGGPGHDVLRAGSGHTTLLGGSGVQFLSGGMGNDNYLGGSGHTTIAAGTGAHDVILSSSAHSTVNCGSTSGSVVDAEADNPTSASCSEHGDHVSNYQAYEGLVTATSGAQISVQYAETNTAAQTWLSANGNPQPAVFDLTGATVHSDTGSITPAVNDCALVLANAPASGTVLPAVFVVLHTCESTVTGLQRYEGLVTGTSGSQMTVAFSEANATAQAWLAANGSPTSVTFDLTGATVESHTGSSTPQVNDCARVLAQTPTSGTVLAAVKVSLHHCEGRDAGLQGYFGQITGVSGSQVTLQYSHANDAAQAWLNANGNPTSVTFDLTNATTESDGGTPGTPAVNDCAEISATSPTSGTVLPAVTLELHSCTHSGGGEGDHSHLRFRGTVASVAGNVIGVNYTQTNDAAAAWLGANGNPLPASFDITGATIESTTGSMTPAVNDCIGVSATAPSSGTTLVAVTVVLDTCGSEGGSQYQLYGGQVTSVAGSLLTLNYVFTNGTAQSWLATQGTPPPTSVTFDLTSATVHSHTGSPTPAQGDCAGVAATTPSSGTTLPAVVVELFPCGAAGGDH